ncbi:hypothetical protein [Sulfuricurvum sp.]|uniref:hypothetical protein n=1 Tax=Sulfuricurvum sp. TaxID=2025608 RepID=UPI002632B2DE|nr:hypothetical protein [Sulfuricurvum sp.]MDD3596123.1 hypothetical protein [Sulfuricurvum sp.]
MKRTQSFSLYALIIAFLVHLIVVLLFIILNQLTPPPPPPQPEPKEEQRFKLSLKERPKIQKEALVKNDIPKPQIKRSIPRGEQLKQPKAPLPVQKPIPVPPQNTPPQPVEPMPAPRKAFEQHVAKPVATIERQSIPKKEQGLYDILSKADGSAQQVMTRGSTRITDSIQRLYGDKFSELSAGEQKYIIDNQELMRRITQGVLDRYGRSKIPDNIRTDDTNMIEFYLYPDGSISDLHFLKNSRLSILDDTTKEVIELAYSKYPRPEQKTLIRYRVWYNLTGY